MTRDLIINEGMMDTLKNILQKRVDSQWSIEKNADSKFLELAKEKYHYPEDWTPKDQDQLDLFGDIRDKAISKRYSAEKLLNFVKFKDSGKLLANIPLLYLVLGAGLAAGVITWAAYKLYKRFLSDAAKSCKNLSGKEKTICMLKYQLKGLEQAKMALTKAATTCGKSNKPAECREKMGKKIIGFNKKITKAKERIKKLA